MSAVPGQRLSNLIPRVGDASAPSEPSRAGQRRSRGTDPVALTG
ncbi:MAG TPA: hypothetical protein VMV92_25920 [Streptosporangiaceae bacterium]|nr:hypothetical protein [Streptosporangiaceae bacterium]